MIIKRNLFLSYLHSIKRIPLIVETLVMYQTQYIIITTITFKIINWSCLRLLFLRMDCVGIIITTMTFKTYKHIGMVVIIIKIREHKRQFK